MDHFESLNRSVRDLLDHHLKMCWKCKEMVEEHDIVAVTDGRTSWVEYCQDCLRFHREHKKFYTGA
ncbi:hypothetical protein [Halobacillus naozhouensis]|uniref:LIM zinc-binding domain-containing protein n=1 Tax=Halobacillus naozhouensis TaxID=554880 RepID=A0ABY8IUR1_9BACI|nr:hypothetical protein [Halobacillus naozhouensis]WFT73862.1 hypothetical protein P9989_16015 [Halobacillus naozhouensis]